MASIELLAPARDLETGLAAINCGADAIYIGAPQFSARAAAGNRVTDIERLVQYAHQYWAKVYVTVNTLLYDHEIPAAQQLISQLYQAGVDALIIQDVGLLECDLPPLPLFASTQMHNYDLEKIIFLEQVGFQRVILARELNLKQIQAIRSQTQLELEFFVHGALCVCLSGQCYLSYARGGRSGNRGECAQPCRRPYLLKDHRGHTRLTHHYPLSLKDLNLAESLADLLQAGITSFKIEGRLKDKNYVMNVVAFYRQQLDQLLLKFKFRKSSSGQSYLDFTPDLSKTFNRGYTQYFLKGADRNMGSINTPKSMGEQLGPVTAVTADYFVIKTQASLHNGDGICFFDQQGQLRGSVLNRVAGNKIYPAKMQGLSAGLIIYRNHDREFLNQLKSSQVTRKIALTLHLKATPDGFCLLACDEDANAASFELTTRHILAEQPELARQTIHKQLVKLGGTEFSGNELILEPEQAYFLPIASLNELRRGVIENLRQVRQQHYHPVRRVFVPNAAPYPEKSLTYTGNVLNQRAVQFYRRHGADQILPAAESGLDLHGQRVMTTKYCLRRQLGECVRENAGGKSPAPWYLIDSDQQVLELKFNCDVCQMEIYPDPKKPT